MVATYDFAQTRDDIIKRALRIVGVLADGDTPTTDQTNNGATALNSMVKRWQNDHVFLWTITSISLPTIASTETYSMTSYNIVDIDTVVYRDSTNYDFPLKRLNWGQYQDQVDKVTSTGTPLSYTYRLNNSTLYIYPVPDAIYALKVFGVKLLADFDAAGDAPDAPARWFDALTYGLADSLADEYLLPGSERQYIHGKAEAYRLEAKRNDQDKSDMMISKGAY